VALFFKFKNVAAGNQRMFTKTQSKIKQAKWIGCLLILLSNCVAYAQEKDSITVQLTNTVFHKGDTIGFEVNLQNYTKVAKTATIQLWIENIKTGGRWRYRYPLVNGYISAKLKVDSSLPDGLYAFNFLMQKSFFTLNGHAQNITTNQKVLNYVMISKNKQTVADFVELNDQQSFAIRNLLFQDSAFIIFADPKQKHKSNNLLINIETPLDSVFVPVATGTKFIMVGHVENDGVKKAIDTAGYVFKTDDGRYKMVMPEVVVKTKSKKRLEDFDRENTTGSFTGSDAIILDGISSDEIANAPDLYTYLSIKVGGLRLETDNTTGNQSFSWRGQAVDMYINEIKLDPEIPVLINPSDIAMIKIFRPGSTLSADTGAGGAFAVYTKTAQYSKATNRNYSFFINGYTGLDAVWK
jgi:hypothetical protein